MGLVGAAERAVPEQRTGRAGERSATASPAASAQRAPAAPSAAPGDLAADEVLVRARRCATGQHVVQFYEDDGFLAELVADWFAEGLERGEACVSVATADHELMLFEALARRGHDPQALRDAGQLTTFDAHDALDTFMVEQQPDEGCFVDAIGGMLGSLEAGPFKGIRVFGEMLALLARQGMFEQAARLEDFWNRLAARQRFALLCAYPMALFGSVESGRYLRDICGRHTGVVPAESFLRAGEGVERQRLVVDLQQRALALADESTRRQREQSRVRERDERLRLLGELTQAASWVARNGHIAEANEHCLDLLGARHEWQVLGRSPLDFIHADDHEAVEQRFAAMLAGIGDVPAHSLRLRRLDGRVVETTVTAASFEDDGDIAIQMVLRPAQLAQSAEADADAAVDGGTLRLHAGSIDAVTGLADRAAFTGSLAATLESVAGAASVAVLHVDLDRFQIINDTLGLEAGDALLREASHRLKRALRDGPCLARCGGDEFIVHVRAEDAEREARRLAALIVAAFHEPFAISARSVFVSPSIGMSLFPAHGAEARELMRCADLALHAAKRAGGNTAVVYDPRMAEDLASRLDIESRLRRALDQDEFRLCYQPIYDIVTGRIVAVEALLRWLPEDGPVMMPADFIPIAEETGLIQPIGDWVLRAACQQVRRWQTELPGCAELRLNVNVSPRQLRDLDPRGSVQRFLEESGLPAASLTLELTESTFLKDLEPTLRNLDQLRSMGVRLSIDDFGTGYSCLAYLRRLPIDELKIDRSFVHELVRSPEDAALISAILAMAQALGLEVIAEGIESWGQLEMLREKGCRRVQGYRLGRPMYTDDAGEFLAARARPAARGFKATDLLPA